MKKSYYLLLIPLLAIALLGPGCSCGEKVAEKAMEKAIESSTNSDVDIDYDDNTITYETDEGTTSWGEGAELPSDWPKDVPVYKDATVTSSSSYLEDETYTATLATDDSHASVVSYYESEIAKQGWTVDDTYEFSDSTGKSTSYSASKGDRSLTVGVYEYDGEVSITLSAGKSTF